jgi:hypothetical protein
MAAKPQIDLNPETMAVRAFLEGRADVISNERHYSPAEIAELWNLSVDCVRKIFESEPGVLVIGKPQTQRGKRNYTTLRIPQSVLDRVHRRLRKV